MHPSITIELKYFLKKPINRLQNYFLCPFDATEGDRYPVMKWNNREAEKKTK